MNIPNGGFPPIICIDKNININKELKKFKKDSINIINLLKQPKKTINVDTSNDNSLDEIKDL